MQIITPSLSIAFMGVVGYAFGHFASLNPKQTALIGMAIECANQIFCNSFSTESELRPLTPRISPSDFQTCSTNSTYKIAVLIHGCHLQADEWEKIVFGGDGHLGRVPIGIEEAIHKKAALIFWGSGASQTSDGKTESEYTFSQAIGPKLKHLALHVKKDSQGLFQYLKQISYIDHKSQNTAEELDLAIKECLSRNISELILISSPTHIARCLQEACKIKFKQPDIPIKFYARASETCFADSTPADVTVIEPPHRKDKPKVPFHLAAKRLFPLLRNPKVAFEFYHAWSRLLDEHENQIKITENQHL